MSKRTMLFLKLVIVFIIAAVTGWSVTVGSIFIPVAVIIAGLAALYLMRKRVTEVIEDERIHRIDEKASSVTIQVYGVLTALVAVVLLALDRSGQSGLRETGLALAYSVCFLLLVRLVLYYHYQRKY